MRDLEDEARIKAYMQAKMKHIKMYNECMNLADGLDVEQFAELVRQDEREACAKVCDEFAAKDKFSNYYAVAARAIRSRVVDGATVGEVGIWGEEPVDAVNMSQDRVDETAKGEHKREWVGLTRRELDIATLNLEDLGDSEIAIAQVL